MRCIVQALTKARADELAVILEAEGHEVDVRFLGSLPPMFRTDQVRVMFIDRDFGAIQIDDICQRLRASIEASSAVVVLFGRPASSVETDRLVAAGVRMHVGELDDAFVSRLRFVEKMAEDLSAKSAASHGPAPATDATQATDATGQASAPAPAAMPPTFSSTAGPPNAAEETFRGFLEQISDGVLIHDLTTIYWANRRWTQLAGFDDPSEVAGSSLFAFMPARDRAPVHERQRKRRVQVNSIPLSEGRLLRKDGVEVDVEICGTPTVFEGRPAFLTMVRDITEKRRMTLDLLAADRLSVLSSLAANIGHEINNSLVYIMANVRFAADRLRNESARTDDSVELLDEALDGTERIAQIVADLGFFRGTDVIGDVDIHRLLDSCLRMAQSTIRSRARVVRSFKELPKVRANDARLAQVLLNVLTNAAQAIPERAGEDNHVITVATEALPDRVLIRISDTGIGIPPEHLKRVFEPFFTTRGDRGGTGLGLSICMALLASQGGDITVDSEVGRGTTVTLTLPQAPSASEPKGAAIDEPTASSGVRRRVLVVDDEPFVARSIRDSLSRYDIDIASGGREAMELIDASPYDAIVCDVMMPGMSGKDLYAELQNRRRGEEARVVFITGGAYTADAAAFVGGLKNPCVEKPFRMALLVAAIEGVVRTG